MTHMRDHDITVRGSLCGIIDDLLLDLSYDSLINYKTGHLVENDGDT